MTDAEPASNAPPLTVSELSGALKRTIEDRFGYVRVRGKVVACDMAWAWKSND